MASGFPSQDVRPLKKARLGPPDVYPQDFKQKELSRQQDQQLLLAFYSVLAKLAGSRPSKEDELTPNNLKHGYSNLPITADEFGSARKNVAAIDSHKFGPEFMSILAKKEETNTLQDSSKKKQQINAKDNFFPVTARSRGAMELWFKDLAGTKPLSQLGKRVPVFNKKEEIFCTLCEFSVPVFNKKEEIFCTLCEFSVPIMKAAWLIKMTAVHIAALQENKTKKRQTTDQALEWTIAISKFLKDQLQKIQEYYVGATNGPHTSFLTATPSVSQIDMELAVKQWNFTCRLARHMYEEGLLDRHEYLVWLLEILEKMRQPDDTIVKLILSQVLQYVEEFTLNQLLSRRLAHYCAKKISQMCGDTTCPSPRTHSPMATVTTVTNPAGITSTSGDSNAGSLSVFNEYQNCPQHRGILLTYCAIITTITLKCPTSLIWHNLGEGKTVSILSGSPLDLLPCPPSCLPMPPGTQNAQIRTMIRNSEEQIKQRSRAVELRWSSDKRQQSATGDTIEHILSVLEMLDRHNFGRSDANGSLDSIYNKVFKVSPGKESSNSTFSAAAMVALLVDWAVCTDRTGYHRALVVSKVLERRQSHVLNQSFYRSVCTDRTGYHRALVVSKVLERRQSHVLNQKQTDCEGADDKDDTGSEVVSVGTPPFQSLLMQFLDERAPVPEEHPTEQSKQAFSNLIHLFCELIHHEIFSHDSYMCTLIARGDISTSQQVTMIADSVEFSMSSIVSENQSIKHEHTEHTDEIKMDIDMDSMEQYDLTRYVPIEQPKISPVNPSSVKSVKNERDPTTSQMSNTATTMDSSTSQKPTSHRHVHYATHFPIPQDENSYHESNQRMAVLYGVGRVRDDVRKVLKKITKEIMRMFSKKNALDVNSGAVAKERKFNPEIIYQKFQKLSYYDQHAVTMMVSNTVVEQLTNFVNDSACYLPLVDNVSYLFDLMEHALCIHGLVNFGLQILKLLSKVESQLVSKKSCLVGTYTSSLCLCIVSLYRKYHSYLMLCPHIITSAFQCLMTVVKQIATPDNTSAERCILAYIYDVYTQCSYLSTEYSDAFSSVYARIKTLFFTSTKPSSSNLLWDPEFMVNVINNPNVWRGTPVYRALTHLMTIILWVRYASLVLVKTTKPSSSNLWDPEFMVNVINNPKNPIEPSIIQQLNDNEASRYSFVCNAMLCICNSQYMDKLNEISLLCAELTAKCRALSSEWLGVLKALCYSSNHSSFIDILTQIDVSDLSIHDSLAVFTAILISRHCFTPEELIHVALPSLMAACPSTGGCQDAEPGARLTCHLLLRLFKPSTMSSNVGLAHRNSNAVTIKASCDSNLLAAAHDSITAGAVLAVLKAMLVLGDSCESDSKSTNSNQHNKSGDMISSLFGSMYSADMDMDMMLGTKKGCMETTGLSDYAKHSLKEMCCQEWVRDKFLNDPHCLFNPEMLLDSMLTPKQAQQLLEMLCYPNGIPNQVEGSDPDIKQIIHRILLNLDQWSLLLTRLELQNLDRWSLRLSWLELQLMFKLTESVSESKMSALQDAVAKGTIELFQLRTAEKLYSCHTLTSNSRAKSETEKDGVWLIAPLISKLPSSIQGKILKLAGNVLESGNNFLSKSKADIERNQKSKCLLSHQPFLSLVLMCLKGEDEQKEVLLNSLHIQIENYITTVKELLDNSPDERQVRQDIHEALQLRLSLVGGMFETIQKNSALTTEWVLLLLQIVGGMFETIQKNSALTTEWVLLLLQIVSNHVLNNHKDDELLLIILDMMCVLIQGTQVSDGNEKGEDNKKANTNLIKKLKKEIGDKSGVTIDQLRQLIPIPKKCYDVIVCEPYGTVSTKGNKIAVDLGKKQGHQVSSVAKINPWEVIEGFKNPVPLSFHFFGAMKSERKPAHYEHDFKKLLYHTHSLINPISHYLEPPVLPPDDAPPIQEKLMVQLLEKSSDEIDINQREDLSGRKGKKKGRRQSKTGTEKQAQARQMGYPQDPSMYPGGMSQNWVYRPQQPPQQYYPPQGQQPPQHLMSTPRYPHQSHSKVALSTMLRARQPASQVYNQAPQSITQNQMLLHKQHQQQMLRQRISQHQNRMAAEGGGMYGNGVSGVSAVSGYPTPAASMNYQQQGQMGMMDNSSIMQQHNTGYQGGGGGMMMRPQGQTGAYTPQQQYGGRMGPGIGQPNNSMMSSGYGQQKPGYNMTPMSQQRIMQQRQHQLLMQQQQQQQQQQQMPGGQTQNMQSQQQQTAAFVAQLERQMSTGSQGQAQGPPPQYPSYQQPPPQY